MCSSIDTSEKHLFRPLLKDALKKVIGHRLIYKRRDACMTNGSTQILFSEIKSKFGEMWIARQKDCIEKNVFFKS